MTPEYALKLLREEELAMRCVRRKLLTKLQESLLRLRDYHDTEDNSIITLLTRAVVRDMLTEEQAYDYFITEFVHPNQGSMGY